MSLVSLSGQGVLANLPFGNNTPAFGTSGLIDATGEKVAFSGRVWTPNRGSKNIYKIHWRFGAVTKAGGSALIVSLQTPLTTGFGMFPDEPGTLPYYRAITNADAAFVSNTWWTSGIISSDGTNGGSLKTVAFGERVSVVCEFDGAGRLGGDSVIVNTLAGILGNGYHGFACALKTASFAGISGVAPNIIFEFDDGTFGCFIGTFPVSAINAHTYNSGTATTDEHALEFQVPMPCKIEAAFMVESSSAITGDFDVNLYSGTSILATAVGLGEDQSGGSTPRPQVFIFPTETTLAANTTYRIGVRPNQATNSITVYSVDVNDANHWTVHPFGTAWKYATRVDLGSWAAATATRRLMVGVQLSALDNGVQSPSFDPFASPVIKAA